MNREQALEQVLKGTAARMVGYEGWSHFYLAPALQPVCCDVSWRVVEWHKDHQEPFEGNVGGNALWLNTAIELAVKRTLETAEETE